jgi:uncharacterized membrane protein YgcG
MLLCMTSTDAVNVRRARIARVRMIRHRVVAGALALFVATWVLITLMLVTGHDPALARQASAKAAATQTTASSDSTSSAGKLSSAGKVSSAGKSSSTGSSSTTGSSASIGSSSVTSSQS